MQDNTSPEERLLRLIRKPAKKSQTQKQAAQGKPLQGEQGSRLSLILLASLSLLGVYLIGDFLALRPQRPIKFRPQALSLPDAATSETEQEEPLTYYLAPVKSRNLFTASAQEPSQPEPTATFTQMIAKLRLQGIISGAQPQAIIEDTESKQVYFLSPGGYIGEIEIREILPGKVKLNYHGQEAELSL